MRELARRLEEADPDTLVVASPHNLRLIKHIGVVLSENSTGEVVEGRRRVQMEARCDLDLGARILEAADRRGLPVVGANFGALEGPASDLKMDWGTLIPLWFMLGRKARHRRVVIVTPSRGIPLRQNFEFGRVVGGIATEGQKRVAFVASADQAHAHRKDGPYGFSAQAKVYDEKVVRAVETGTLSSILEFTPGLVEAAKPDSLWQMAMLAGALDVVPMRGRLVSYQVPTYYGMLCAWYGKAA
jgi:aromatic ring-opening dioxygenase LigB subunit